MFGCTRQSGMIALARSRSAKVAMQRFATASALASRFVAGANAEESVDRATALHIKRSIRGSLFHLGEHVDRAELAVENLSRSFHCGRARLALRPSCRHRGMPNPFRQAAAGIVLVCTFWSVGIAAEPGALACFGSLSKGRTL
jgi:hypothetical protein